MGNLEDMERELGITGEVGEAEARGARVMLRRLFLDVEQAIAYRKIAKAGPRNGRGGPLGGFPVDALNELARRLGVEVEP